MAEPVSDGSTVTDDPAGGALRGSTAGQPEPAGEHADDHGADADLDGARAPGPTGGRALRWAMVAGLAPLVMSALVTLVLVGSDYVPVGDLAMTEMHVRDIGHHPVLVGLHSRPFWSHPGPLQFYVVAPFYWLTGGSSVGLVLGALAVNGAAVAGLLAIARRRGGTPLLLCTLVACLLLMRSLGLEVLGDSWNLRITVMPFALLVFLTWSMLSGEWWALPVGTVVATFLVQTHIGFVAMALPMLALGAGVLGVRAARGWGVRPERRRAVRATLVSGALLAVLWLPPLIDIAVHAPDNRDRILDYFSDPGEATQSIGNAWRVTTGQFGPASEWLTGKLPRYWATGESPYAREAPVPVALAVFAAAGLVLWRRHPEGRGLVVSVAAVTALVMLSILRTVGVAADYRLLYTWVPPALAAAAVLWAGWLACADRWPGGERWLRAAGAGTAAVLAVVVTVSAARAGTPHADDGDAIAALSEPVIAAYAGADGPVVVNEVLSVSGNGHARGLVLQMERHGIEARVPEHHAMYFSPERVYDGGPVAAHLVFATDDDIESLLDDPNLRLIARWTDTSPGDADAVAARMAELEEVWHAGEISDDEYLAFAGAARAAGKGNGAAIADGAVFVDERPPSERGTIIMEAPPT